MNQGTRPGREREYPVLDVLGIVEQEGQGDRGVATLLPDHETLVTESLDRRVPEIQHTQRSAHLLLGIDDGKVLDGGPVDHHLDGLSASVRIEQGHVAAHVLGVPAGVDVRRLLVEVEEVRVHRYVGRHLDL